MAKTYNTLGTVAPGDVLRANSGTASYNGVITNVNNYRVPPSCSLYRSAAWTHPTHAAYVAVPWDAERYTQTDSGMWAASPNQTRINLVTPGIYMVSAGIGFGVASSTIVALAISVDGSYHSFFSSDIGLASVRYMNGTTLVKSDGTNYVEVMAYQSTGTTMAMAVGATTMWVHAVWQGQVS